MKNISSDFRLISVKGEGKGQEYNIMWGGPKI